MFFIHLAAEEQRGVGWHPAGSRTSPAVADVFGVEGFALPGADDFVLSVGENEVAVDAVDFLLYFFGIF